MSRVGGIGTAFRGRRRSRCVVGGMTRPQCSSGSKTVPRPFRKLDYEKALARAWVAAGQGAVSEAIGMLEVGSRDGGSERTIRGGSGVPADGDAVG